MAPHGDDGAAVIDASGVVKTFGSTRALDGLDLRVQRGEVHGTRGALANELSISVDEAFRIIRRHARNHNAKLSVVADAVVNLNLRPSGWR